jgi:uncharacterized protein (TIGR02996 family)
MSERKAFQDALAKDPYDWATRQVYADWLEENGHDDEAALQRRSTPDAIRKAHEVIIKYAADLSVSPWGEDDNVLITVENVMRVAGKILDNKGIPWTERESDWWKDAIVRPSFHSDLESDTERAKEFWAAFEVITGRVVPDDTRDEIFVSCSC